jgi:hypothetical protein
VNPIDKFIATAAVFPAGVASVCLVHRRCGACYKGLDVTNQDWTMGGPLFHQGSHICAIDETAEEQHLVAVVFIADGLSARERCIYVGASPDELDRFRSGLRTAGIDVGETERSRALVLLTNDRVHLADGRFEIEPMLRMLNTAVEDALNDGLAGLRICGDMSWLLDTPPGAEHVAEYEAMLNQFFRNARGLGMCQYDRQRLPEGILDRAGIAAHSSVVIGNRHKANPFCEQGPAPECRPDATSLDAKLNALRNTD